jgi:hypothetical protein
VSAVFAESLTTLNEPFTGTMNEYEALREEKRTTYTLPELGSDMFVITTKQFMSKEGKKLHKASPLLYDLLEGVDQNYAYTRHHHSSLMEECGRTTFLNHRTKNHGYFHGKNGCFGRIQSYHFGNVVLDTAFGNVEPDHPESGDTQFITFGIRYFYDR